MYREIAGTDERVRAIPGVRDRRVRATKVRLYFNVDSDISLAVSTRMPYCPILTFEDDSTYKHAKDKSDCNSFLLAVLSKFNG